MTAQELLPCPCCAESATLYIVYLGEQEGYAQRAIIRCDKSCVVTTRTDKQNPNGGYALAGTGAAEAIAIWNTRSDLCIPRHQHEAEVAAVVEAVADEMRIDPWCLGYEGWKRHVDEVAARFTLDASATLARMLAEARAAGMREAGARHG